MPLKTRDGVELQHLFQLVWERSYHELGIIISDQDDGSGFYNILLASGQIVQRPIFELDIDSIVFWIRPS